MSLGVEKKLAAAAGRTIWPAGDVGERLNIAVIFTTVESTLAALKEAATLADELDARITLIVPQVVPYPLPLEDPPVTSECSGRRFRVIANESPVDTTVQICLCRDRFDAVNTVLRPGSIVILGDRKRWWPTKNQILARRLRSAGYEVIFKETE